MLSPSSYGRSLMSIAALLLVLPAISLAQQIAIGSYSLPTALSYPNAIAAGPDGALWFTEFYAGKIGRITTAGAISEYPLPAGSADPAWIVAGADGALWFTENGTGAGKIGRITTSGVITDFPVPAGFGAPSGIANGPDGALWFAENGQLGVPAIGRITTLGLITEYPVPTSNSDPFGIIAGPDGALWFTEFNAGQIGRIATNGAITEYPIPAVNSGPVGITAGPDGALWFAESNKIGRITTAGVLTEYLLPGTQAGGAAGVTSGPDGALWFTEFNGNKIGRITTAGVISEYPLQPAGLYKNPAGIVTGSDGELWFAESGSYGIGEAVFVTASLQVTPASGIDRAPLKFSGHAFAPNESVHIYTSGVGSALLASATADAAGSFTATARAPISPYGPRLFLGVGQHSGDLGAATFSVAPKLFFSPTVGPAGTQVTLKGYGFGSVDSTQIIWNNPFLILGSITTDVAGSFTTHFRIPGGATPGSDTVEAEGSFSLQSPRPPSQSSRRLAYAPAGIRCAPGSERSGCHGSGTLAERSQENWSSLSPALPLNRWFTPGRGSVFPLPRHFRS